MAKFMVLIDLPLARKLQEILYEIGRGDLKDELEALITESARTHERRSDEPTRQTVKGALPVPKNRVVLSVGDKKKVDNQEQGVDK